MVTAYIVYLAVRHFYLYFQISVFDSHHVSTVFSINNLRFSVLIAACFIHLCRCFLTLLGCLVDCKECIRILIIWQMLNGILFIFLALICPR